MELQQRRLDEMISIPLEGKRLAVVGNARSLLSYAHGAAIDGHDLVLRMNRGLPVNGLSQGQRTDILAFSTIDIIADLATQFGAPSLIWMSPKFRDPSRIACDFYDLNRWAKFRDELGARPSVGAMVLDLLSTQDPAGVSIFGMDFKRSPTSYTTVEHRGPHDFAAEERFCARLVECRGWTHIRDYVDTAAVDS